MLAIDQFDLTSLRAVAQPRCLRRTRRADFHEYLAAVIGQRLVDRAVANPVDVAQQDPAHAQRLARADHDAPTLSVEPNDIQRRAGGDTETATLSNGEMNNAGM